MAALPSTVGAAAGVEAGIGYDGNLAMKTGLLPDGGQATGGGVTRLEPFASVDLAFAGGHRLALGYHLGLVQSFAGTSDQESILDQQAELAYHTPRWAGFRLSIGARLRHMALRQRVEQGWLSGGPGLWIQRTLADSWRAALGYTLDWTRYRGDQQGGGDQNHGWELELGWRLVEGVSLTASYRLTWSRDQVFGGHAVWHAPGVAARWLLPWAPLMVKVGYGPSVVRMSTGEESVNPAGKIKVVLVDRDDLIHQVSVEAVLDLLPWLDLFARYQGIWGSSDRVDDYTRHQTCLGVTVHGWWSHRWAPKRVVQTGGRVVLEAVLDARRVAVVGGFNNWDPRTHPMRGSGTSWTVTLDLPPGRYPLALWVDGAVRPVPGCTTWAPDGFGGKNCLVEVLP